jgi:hypothetical protein
MGTDYDSWLLNIVEGDSGCDDCGEDVDDCICGEDDYENDNFDERGAVVEAENQYANWLESLKDRGGR